MGWLLLAWAAVTTPASAEVEAGDVRIRVHVSASIYTYEVANLGRDSITRFEFDFSNGYDFQCPDGWESEYEGGVCRAWAQHERYAIRRGCMQRFSIRVSSRGAVLGHVRARIGRLSGDSVTLGNVWGGVPEPRGHVLLVACVVGFVFVLHSRLSARRDRSSLR